MLCILYGSSRSSSRLRRRQGNQNVSQAIQRFSFDPLLAILFLAFVTAGAGALLFLFDRRPGLFGVVLSPASHKLAPLEGLRGILAFSVVAHHAYCWYFFAQTGIWFTGRGVIFDRLAGFGVMQFFYLSGFLFWSKLMKRGRIATGRFYLSRFVRIAPVYYICVAAAILLALLLAGFKLQVPPQSFLTSLLPWILFSLGARPEVNHADIVRITCGVTWTLALEWLFYLSLPFLAWFSRKAPRLLFLAVAFGGLFMLSRYLRSPAVGAERLHAAGEMLGLYSKFMLIGFGGGMLVAALAPRLSRWLRPLLPWRSWIVLGLYIAYLTVPGIANAGQILLLAAFALVVEGADLFGFLTWRTTRLLGLISYPVYLLHGMVYFAAMRGLGGVHPVSLLPYMVQTAGCLAVILILATALHLLVERPTMKISEQIARAASVPQTVSP
jgi:peptidoglycan/LPS O-acetylase OafA/YrhL